MTRCLPLFSAAFVLGVALLPSACSVSGGDPAGAGATGDAQVSVRLPDTMGGFDYQLGGPYPPRAGVTIVERDRTAEPSGAGLAIAQKNTAGQVSALRVLRYDFAVTESCFEFQECAACAAGYLVVLDIEYTHELGEDGFANACGDPDRPAIMIQRDSSLVTPRDGEYVYRSCE